MRVLPTLAAAALALSALPVLADEAMPFGYGIFEGAVPHLDLETCPAELAGENRFCRLTIGHDEVHVFAFSRDGDVPLVGHASWHADDLDLGALFE
ncbi:MAG: hypothetical protein WCZ72_05045 [Gemmobacter sp.]